MKIVFAEPKTPSSGTFVALAAEGLAWAPAAAEFDKASGGTLGRAAKAARFDGKKGEVLDVLAPSGVGVTRVLVIGIGKPSAVDELAAQAIGGAVVAKLLTAGESDVAIAVEAFDDLALDLCTFAAQIGYGAELRSYCFDKYHTKKKPEEKPSLRKVTLLVEKDGAAKKAFAPLSAVAEGVFFTRDLVSEPANVIYPESFAKGCEALEKLGVKVEVLGEAEMRKLGMGSLLGVGQGSARESQLLILQWNGGKSKEEPIAFIGKGVTFDTGGISIKPAAGMEDMKWDMGGAGAVVGLIKALAGRKAKVNAVGVAGLVENMPSSTAQRPGDVVTSMSGQTIEVLNTDAEGRLVLADALWYTQDRFKPKFMVNLATLTGAVIVALGHEHAGLFSNDDDLAAHLIEAGLVTGEKLWRLPLHDAYDKLMNSEIADLQNISGDRGAGSITAAQFLQRFVNGVPWAHLDIAGVAWSKKDSATAPKGGTGYGVRLLDRLVADHYEG